MANPAKSILRQISNEVEAVQNDFPKLLHYYGEDCQLLTPELKLLKGKEAIEQHMKQGVSQLKENGIDVRLDVIDAVDTGGFYAGKVVCWLCKDDTPLSSFRGVVLVSKGDRPVIRWSFLKY